METPNLDKINWNKLKPDYNGQYPYKEIQRILKAREDDLTENANKDIKKYFQRYKDKISHKTSLKKINDNLNNLIIKNFNTEEKNIPYEFKNIYYFSPSEELIVIAEKALLYKNNTNKFTFQDFLKKLDISDYIMGWGANRTICNNHDAEVLKYALNKEFGIGVFIVKTKRKYIGGMIEQTATQKTKLITFSLAEANKRIKKCGV